MDLSNIMYLTTITMLIETGIEYLDAPLEYLKINEIGNKQEVR